MKTVADIKIDPIGEGTSIRGPVEEAIEMLGESGLRTRVHALGTEVEGDMDKVLAAIEHIHQRLHEEGHQRISTSIRLETRTDRPATMAHAGA